MFNTIFGIPTRTELPKDTIIFRDQKATSTAGGTFTTGAWQTRTLNTVFGLFKSVTQGTQSYLQGITWATLDTSTNRIALLPGVYEITARAPGSSVNTHQCRFQNITDGSVDIIGNQMYAAAAGGVMNESTIKGFINITAPKVFELQHRCETTKASDGFGVATASFGDFEYYAEVRIQRLNKDI